MPPLPDGAAGRPSGREDAVAGALWCAFGVAVAIGAWRMDRLERLNINPYEAPGLVPGLLGLVIVVLGGILAVRGLRHEAALTDSRDRAAPASSSARDGLPRMAAVLGLTLAYALLLVGRGLPFWLSTFVFVTAFIGWLDRERQRELGRAAWAQWLRAAAYGAAWSAIVSLSFEHVFLVRLP